ncbi:unnamed protein product [Brachionus calyciflorus]|uniref:Uncharacterized protein n=1 Tax=Brachionus calyciflorus TaxID=104777 RepID=A0A814NIV3_9BILA|nr:unnamed protein product [Brachionus calyciflorus]
MNIQKQKVVKKRGIPSNQQKVVIQNAQMPNSESFRQPLIKSPRLERKSKSVAKENKIEDEIDNTEPSCSKDCEVIDSPIKPKPKQKLKPKKKVLLADDSETECEQIKNTSASNNVTFTTTNNESVLSNNSNSKSNNDTFSKYTQTTPIKQNSPQDTEDKFTLKFIGQTLMKVLKNQTKIGKTVRKIDFNTKVNKENNPERRVMYKDINLANVEGSDPNKYARNVAKIIFSNIELMTCLLPKDIKPILQLNETDINEESVEEEQAIINFPKTKNYFLNWKVKLLADSLKLCYNIDNDQLGEIWHEIRISVHSLGRTIEAEYAKKINQNKIQKEKKSNGEKETELSEEKEEGEENEDEKERDEKGEEDEKDKEESEEDKEVSEEEKGGSEEDEAEDKEE